MTAFVKATRPTPVVCMLDHMMPDSRRKPAFAGIDLHNTYIDRKSDDNAVAATQ